MKSKRFWTHFIFHKEKRPWVWKPTLLKSQLIYNSGGKMWLAPYIEFCWLFIVLQFSFYSRKKEYNGNYYESECCSEILQDRINVLENAIRLHKKNTGREASQKDLDLWSSLG